MAFNHWNTSPVFLFSQSPIIPVIVLHDLAHAVPVAKALLAGGINVLEITLRTPIALDAIRLIKKEVPEAIVGAGTITCAMDLERCIEAGAEFALSPGFTEDLLLAGKHATIPLIPGIMTVSELMQGMALGYSHFKFFPAEAAGGVRMLKSIYGPFPDVAFCPTGGISEKNMSDYLSLPNVSCVGGSWILPEQAINQGNWQKITELSLSAVAQTQLIN